MIRPIGNKAAITFDQLKMAEKQMDPSLKSFLVKIDLGQTSGKEKNEILSVQENVTKMSLPVTSMGAIFSLLRLAPVLEDLHYTGRTSIQSKMLSPFVNPLPPPPPLFRTCCCKHSRLLPCNLFPLLVLFSHRITPTQMRKWNGNCVDPDQTNYLGAV